MVPQRSDFGDSRRGLGSGSGTAHTRIARVLADALRNQKNAGRPL